MAKHRAELSNGIREPRSCLSGAPSHRGIKKQAPKLRRSARLSETRVTDNNYEVPSGKLQRQTAIPQANDRKRKRQQEPEDEIHSTRPLERLRAHPGHPKERTPKKANCKEVNPIKYWTEERSWPKEYFEQDDQTKENFKKSFEKDWWFEKYWASGMDPPLRMKTSASSLRRVQTEYGFTAPTSTTPSDQKPREVKSAPYKHPGYRTQLANKGSFMDKYKDGPRNESKDLCQKLLEEHQDVPKSSRFSDNVFDSTCRRIQDRNEAKVIDKIARLIVPSAEDLADFGSEHLERLVEAINEGWNNSLPVTGTRPQPDYSVGFDRSMFTKDQLNKLEYLAGDVIAGVKSYYMATYYMYLPFFTCEVKCGAAALDVADRQNAHSMTLAVRGVVELFKRVGREKEIDREILAFSVSHDHLSVRIYGHYPVIKNEGTTYYRHAIRFTALDGKEKWTAYKFTKNVYDKWMPNHFKRLCSVIDELPSEPDFDVPALSEGTGLSQVFKSHHLSRSDTDSALQEDDSQASLPGSQDITPNTSLSQQGPSKKPRKRPNAG